MTLRHALFAAVICSTATAFASDYITHGVDPGRTGWIKDEKVFTKANVGKMKLLWKVKLESTPREMHNLFNPLVLQNVTTAQGAREMAVVAGVSDDLFGIDVASGELVWKKHFDGAPAPVPGGRGSSTLCPGGQTAVPVVGPGPSSGKQTIYAVSWDGRLRQVDMATGQDVAPPEKFLPPNGKPYTSTASRSCGGFLARGNGGRFAKKSLISTVNSARSMPG